MKRVIDTLIVGAAPASGGGDFYHSIISRATRVIAADAGLAVCLASDRMPDAVVGDFDSIDPALLTRARQSGAEVIAYPADKDVSDLDLALAYARSQGLSQVAFTAAFSQRLDHTLSALGTLTRSADLEGAAREPSFTCHALDACTRPTCQQELAADTTVSLFTVDGGSTVSVDGVRWPLEEHTLGALSSLGLSNRACGGPVRVTVHAGSVLFFVVHSDS